MPAKEYDVLIVGSGHSGGMAANILTKQGVNCLMLNAGPESDFEHNRVNKAVYELPYRGFGKPGRLPHVYQANEFNANQWVDETENPYTHDPANLYNWVRVRLVGGRSLFWARQSFRLSDFEFKAGDLEGTGQNWPISLADLHPYYSRVEEIFRVSGRKEGWPEFPDGNFIEPNYGPDSETIKRLSALGKERGMKFSKMRSSGGQNGLASSVNLLLPDAMATGKLEMVSNAIVREITTDKKTGLANGAHFVDRHSRHERHVKARAVVLAAGTLESTRLLLNSGIANSSGVLGHYLHDQIYGISVVSSVAEARDGKRPAGLMGGSAFIPRFRNLKKDEKRDFIKGYCVIINSGGERRSQPFRRVRRSAAEEGRSLCRLLRLRQHFRRAAGALRKPRADQQERVRRLGNSGAAHRSQGRRQRTQHGEGRRQHDRRVVPRRGLRHRFEDRQLLSAGIQHSRSGHRPHGRQPQDQRAEQVQPEPRHQESFRGGWLQLCDLRLAESDHDHPGALHARLRVSCRPDEETQIC